jgi:hypothetical protein
LDFTIFVGLKFTAPSQGEFGIAFRGSKQSRIQLVETKIDYCSQAPFEGKSQANSIRFKANGGECKFKKMGISQYSARSIRSRLF